MTEQKPQYKLLTLACLAALATMPLHVAAQQVSAGPAEGQRAEAELPAVVVSTSRDAGDLPAASPGGQAATGARLGMLGNVDVLDAPVSVTGYTQQTIRDQQARTVADVLQNDPSVRYTTNSGHMLEHFKIRGLDVNGPSVAFNGLYGIAPKAHIPTEFLERVEVLRGPSALLNGMAPDANLGGTVNLVTKRAGVKPITDFTTSYSSDSYGQAHVDIGRRFGEEQRFGVRFNGAYGSGETGVEGQEKSRRLGALALDYEGNGWNVALDVYNSREKIENGSQAMYGLTGRRGPVVAIGRLVKVPDADSNLFRGTEGIYKDEGIAVRGEFKINENLTAYAAAGESEASGNGLMFGTRVIVRGDNGAAAGYVYNVHTVTRDKVAEAGLRGQFQTGAVSHAFNASASVLHHRDGSSNRASEGWAQNIYDPVTPVFPGAPGDPVYSIDNVLSSLALTDTMGFMQNKVLLTLGARLQRVRQKIKDYDESRLSPSLGVVIKPWGENTSLFANYMEGLSPGDSVPIASGYINEGESFKPLQTKQLELGVKQRLGGFTHTLSAFQIDRPTLKTNADRTLMFEGGKQRLQGVEWTLFGQLMPRVNLLGGAAYLKAEQRDTDLDSFGVPDWTANLGAEWATPVEGLSVGGRVVYTGRQWLDAANTLRLPSAHRYDVSAKYKTRMNGIPVTLNAFIENLTGRDYWSGVFSDGYAMPAPPRTLRLAATFSF